MTIEEKCKELTEELHKLLKSVTVVSVTKTVTEQCPHCGAENDVKWDCEKDGYEMFCPCCGEKIMICSECPEHDNCDWKADFNGVPNCKMMKKPEPEDVLKDFWFKKGDTYFEIDRDNDIDENVVDIEWTHSKGQFTAYHTEEFAKLAQNMRRFYDKLLAFKWCYDRDYKPDFGNDDEKYRISFDHKTNRYIYLIVKNLDNGSVYFSTKEIAQKCCDWLNSEAKYD